MQFLKKLFTIFFILFSYALQAQQDNLVEINLSASVIDHSTKLPIPFSEVKYLNKNIGTLTDNEGKFTLNYFEDNVKADDIFQITANGYDTISTTAEILYKFLNNTNKFFLKKTSSSNDWFEDDLNDENYIFGKIFSVKGPIQGASVKVKNTLIEAKSNFDGYFKIKANLNDILVIDFLGMIGKQLLIEDLDDKYILLKSDAQIRSSNNYRYNRS